MKKSTIQFSLIILLVFQTFIPTLWAQSPQKMSYQSVIRNSSDQLVANKIVGMKISILKGSESGTAVYTETQKPTTNANGLVSIEIGVGSGFDAIDWANGIYFIKTETDPAGGTSYTISGVSQLLSVPYALHAKTVEIDQVDDADADPTNEIQVLSKTGNTVTLSKTGGSFTDAVDDADADPANEIQTLSISGTNLSLSKNGGTVTLPSSGGGDNWGTQTVVTNATLEGNGSTATPLKIAQQAATIGQVLKWNGTTWTPGNDAAGVSGLILPYSQTVANSDFAFSVTNSLNSAIKGSSSSNTGTGIYGYNSATFGFTNGVIGESYSVSGTGVSGKVSASDGFNTGVFGESASKAGTGVYGYNSSTTGSTFGVKGYTSSSDGWGVVGEAPRFGLKGTGGEVGVYGEASFTYGIGVQGVGERYGIFGQGFYGVYGGSNTYDGFGVYGGSQNVGVKGEASSDTGLGVLGYASSATGTTFGVKGLSASPNGTGVYGNNSSVAGTSYGVYGHSSSGSGYGVAGEAGYIGVYGHSTGEGAYQIGVGVAGVGEVGVRGIGSTGIYGETNAFSGGSGVSGYAGNSDGYGVYGKNSSTIGTGYGIKGESVSEYGAGVYGYDSSSKGFSSGVSGISESIYGNGVSGINISEDGNTFGVYGATSSSDGTGVLGVSPKYGVVGQSSASNGIGVEGYSTSASGFTYGIKGISASADGKGVYGYSNGTGIFGESSSNDGTGVYGVAERYGVYGNSNAANGTGVFGYAPKYGVYGECPFPTSGYAGYFNGRLAVTGNVGIGTNDPGYRLDVAGSINLNKGSTGGAIYCNGNEALWFDGNTFSWGYESQLNYFARPVAIGINDYTGYLLTVNGTAAKPGGGTWATWSDIRLKNIQGNYEKGLKEIIALKPVKFNYKVGNTCSLPSDQNYVGFIAQDVQKVFPEAVSEGKDGYLTLDVNSINVALVNAVKELDAENDRLKAESNNLKAENELLKLKNDQIDSRLTKLEKIISASAMK